MINDVVDEFFKSHPSKYQIDLEEVILFLIQFNFYITYVTNKILNAVDQSSGESSDRIKDKKSNSKSEK